MESAERANLETLLNVLKKITFMPLERGELALLQGVFLFVLWWSVKYHVSDVILFISWICLMLDCCNSSNKWQISYRPSAGIADQPWLVSEVDKDKLDCSYIFHVNTLHTWVCKIHIKWFGV